MEKLRMEYYIKERNWKQILEFIKSVKGIYSKDEKRLNRSSVAYGTNSGGFCQKSMAITEVYTNDLRGGAKGIFGRIYWSTQNEGQI